MGFLIKTSVFVTAEMPDTEEKQEFVPLDAEQGKMTNANEVNR